MRVNAWHGALGRPFFDHFFASILDSSWDRFELVLDAFWNPFGSPHRVKLGLKCVLNRHLLENDDLQKVLEKPMPNCQKCPQDVPKIAPRPVQDEYNSDKKVMHFSS